MEDFEKKDEDEELSIDFGKIGSFFKRKKKEENAAEAQIVSETEKTEKVVEKEVKEADEEITLDLKSIGGFFKKHGILFLILIPIILSIWIRMQTAALPFTDEWATNSVYNYYKTQIRSQIDQQYPNLPDMNKNSLVDAEFQKLLKEQRGMIEQQIKSTSEYFKEYYRYEENGKKYVYMPDIDPYFYLRFARNILEKGHPYDVLKDGKPWDNHMLAPNGSGADMSLHSYVITLMYKIANIFSKTTLMQAATYFPIIFIAFGVLFAFLVGKRLTGGNNIAGFFSALMVAVNTAIVNRTTWGHADTDAYNIFFPLLIVWLFVEMFDRKELKEKLIFGGLAGLSFGLYTRFWTGWWFIFDFILAGTGITLIFLFFSKRFSAAKEHLMSLGILIAFSGIFVSLFAGFRTLIQAIFNPFIFSKIKTVAQTTLWPNVFTTVAELNPASIGTVISAVGGKLLFLIAFVGIVLLLLKKDKDGYLDIKHSILLTIWFIGTIYASTKGIRFTLLLAPAFAIAFGVALGFGYDYLSKWLHKGMKINMILSKGILVVLILLLFISPIRASLFTAKHDAPIVNDAWYESLIRIRDNSSENAIINSWWDFGHHFKYIADRAVTFDGCTQVTPMAHWIGKALLTNNEDLAVGILRMVDCGQNNAFDDLNGILNDTHLSIDILNEIIVLDKTQAKKVLEKYISKETVDDVLRYTHCEPPEDYFITSEDMISKSGVWAHFGSWDFEKATLYNAVKYGKLKNKEEAVEFMKKRFNYSESQAEQMYYDVQAIGSDDEANSWIAPWPSYASGIMGCSKNNETVICGNGLEVDLKNHNATLKTDKGIVHPASIVYVDGNDLKKEEFSNDIVPYAFALIPDGDSYISIAMQPQLADSMFTRLFFFQGHGLSHFKLFSHQKGITGTEVYVWKVDWDGKEKLNAFEKLEEKGEVKNEAERVGSNSSEE